MEAKQGDRKGSKPLSEVLNDKREVFERARAMLPSLPEGSRRGAAPATLADALQLVQERQQSLLAAKDPKAKAKAGSAAQHPEQLVPGARVGGSVQSSAYWTLVEVRERSKSKRGGPSGAAAGAVAARRQSQEHTQGGWRGLQYAYAAISQKQPH